MASLLGPEYKYASTTSRVLTISLCGTSAINPSGFQNLVVVRSTWFQARPIESSADGLERLYSCSMENRKLFVGNMAARITQRDLWRFFSPFGLIDECAKFHESYAFVRFVNANDAQRARNATHGAVLKGRKLKVEFAATISKKQSILSSQKKCSYIEPLRRSVNTSLFHSSINSTPILSDHKKNPNRIGAGNLLSNEDFHTPDLLRLAGIQLSSPDEGYETNSPSILNSSCHSRFFPISMHQQLTCSNSLSSQYTRRKEDFHQLSLDLARIRLFSDVSSGYDDDPNSFIE